MKKNIVITALGLLPVILLMAQEPSGQSSSPWLKFIHLEGGLVNPIGIIKEDIPIRQNVNSFYTYQSSPGNVSARTSGFLVGLKWEHFLKTFNIGFSGGVGYTSYRSEITGYSSGEADFFYLRYSMTDSAIKFARIKSITETNSYLNIPLEIKYLPFQHKGIGVFVKLGTEISIANPNHKIDIDFHNKDMETNKDEVTDCFVKPGKAFYSILYGTFGLKYGKEHKPGIAFEVLLPGVYLSKNNFSLFDITSFLGCKLSLHVPVGNKK